MVAHFLHLLGENTYFQIMQNSQLFFSSYLNNFLRNYIKEQTFWLCISRPGPAPSKEKLKWSIESANFTLHFEEISLDQISKFFTYAQENSDAGATVLFRQ